MILRKLLPAALVVCLATALTAATADARVRGRGLAIGIGAGVVGALILGAAAAGSPARTVRTREPRRVVRPRTRTVVVRAAEPRARVIRASAPRAVAAPGRTVARGSRADRRVVARPATRRGGSAGQAMGGSGSSGGARARASTNSSSQTNGGPSQ